MILLKYIVIFFIFSYLGWFYEHYLLNLKNYDKIISDFFGFNVPLFPIYGIAGIILFFIYDSYYFRNFSLFQKVIIASILVNLMECIGGQISELMYKKHVWDYRSFPFAMCNGYISLFTALWWTFLIFIIYLFFNALKLNND